MSFQDAVVLALCIFAMIAGFVSTTQFGSVARRRLLVLYVAVACLTVAATSLARARPLFLLFLCVVSIALPAIALGAIATLTRWRKAQAFLFSLAGCIALAFLISILFGSWEVSASISYCESLADDLETFNSRHGKYPDNLAEIDPGLRLKPLGALLHGDNIACGYKSANGIYSFLIPSLEGFSYWEYRSNARVWIHYD